MVWTAVFLAFVKGLLLGVVAGLPLGPASAAVADTAVRRSFRLALAVGLGGALVDFAYCVGMVAGLGALFESMPGLSRAFMGVGGAVLVVFGLFMSTKKPLDPADSPVKSPVTGATIRASVLDGILVSVMNPALVVSWVLLAGTVLHGFGIVEGVSAGAGVFLGVFGWFAVLAYFSHRGRMKMGPKAVWIPRIVGIILVAYGAFLIGKVSAAIAAWP